jgi:competence protein ComEC
VSTSRRRFVSGVDRLLAAALLLAACGACGDLGGEGYGGDAATDPAPPPAAGAERALEIRVLDVGQGDAVLLRSGGRTALVDAGPSDRIVQRLRELGVDTLDLLVASHNHADHIGGADAVLDSLPVRFYLDNGVPASTRIQQRVLERVERAGVTYLAPEPREISLGSATLRVLPPPPGVPGDEQNNQSVGILVEQGHFQALLTGDSEREEIAAWLAGGAIPDVELLKAAHHGSRDAVTPAWLARARPEVVVISAGEDNGYGHPHPSALRYYCASGRAVYRTDWHGEVTVRVSAGGEYAVAAARPGASGC